MAFRIVCSTFQSDNAHFKGSGNMPIKAFPGMAMKADWQWGICVTHNARFGQPFDIGSSTSMLPQGRYRKVNDICRLYREGEFATSWEMWLVDHSGDTPPRRVAVITMPDNSHAEGSTRTSGLILLRPQPLKY